ncbi:C2 domain-containing protein [Fennellomyces sp. T-0311]|nr:C2 domain-containing protein [Fennellomyces sp. T-0311]
MMGFGRSHPAGTLTVNVYEAKDLKDQDLIGKNDPHIELYLDKEYKQRTSVMKNTNNPVWNETFTFNIEAGSSHHKLYLQVLDKDKIGTDKIGDTKVDIKDVYEGRVFDDWVTLPAKLGLTSHGEVHLRIEFVPY